MLNQLPKEVNPYIGLPGNRPNCPVELDKDHKLYRPFNGYWLGNKSLPENLVNDGTVIDNDGYGNLKMSNGNTYSDQNSGLVTNTRQPDLTSSDNYIWCIKFLGYSLGIAPGSVVFGNRYDGDTSPLTFFKIKMNGYEAYVGGLIASASWTATYDTIQEFTVVKTGTTWKAYIDGDLVDTDTSVTTTLTNNPVYIGNGRAGSSGENTNIEIIHAYHGPGTYTDWEVKELCTHPYQILKPKTPDFYFTPDTATGTTITPSTGTISITGQDVEVSIDITLSPVLDDITITGFDVTLEEGQNTFVTPGEATVAITGQDVTSITANLVQPTEAILSITGQDTTLDFNTQVVPGTANLIINGLPVTVSAVFIITSTKNIIATLCKPILSNIIKDMVD